MYPIKFEMMNNIKKIEEIMSYTHTLSIQGIQAILQMNVENSVVKYTLTLRANSGEEVITNGRLPSDAMDNFIVINQHFTNPEPLPVPSKDLGDSLSSEVKKTLEKGVKNMLEENVKDTAAIVPIPENKLHHSHSSITMFFDLPDAEDSLSESFSPILPSSPRHIDDSGFAHELQDLSNKVFIEPQMAESLQPEHLIQVSGEGTIQLRPVLLAELVEPAEPAEPIKPVEPVQEEDSSQRAPFNEAAIMKQLEHLLEYSNLDIKKGIIAAVRDHIIDHMVDIREYPTLSTLMKDVFYELLALHLNDDVMKNKIIEMLYVAGEKPDTITEYIYDLMNQYDFMCKVASHYKILLHSYSLAKYRKWKQTNRGKLNRWNLMKLFLHQ